MIELDLVVMEFEMPHIHTNFQNYTNLEVDLEVILAYGYYDKYTKFLRHG